MALLPAPQNASIIVSHLHLSAISFAISSGVTENQLSKKNIHNYHCMCVCVCVCVYIYIYIYVALYYMYINKSIILKNIHRDTYTYLDLT